MKKMQKYIFFKARKLCGTYVIVGGHKRNCKACYKVFLNLQKNTTCFENIARIKILKYDEDATKILVNILFFLTVY